MSILSLDLFSADRRYASHAVLTFEVLFPGQHNAPSRDTVLLILFLRHRTVHVWAALHVHIFAILLLTIDARLTCEFRNTVNKVGRVDRSRLFGDLPLVEVV